MVITSENKTTAYMRYGNTQFRYAIIYVLVTLVVLTVLNIYCANITQEVFNKSKQASMIEKCLLTGTEIANLDIFNSDTISDTISRMGSLNISRMIITDQTGLSVYDSVREDSTVGKYVLFPEIVMAMEGNDVFSSSFQDKTMLSHAATPIISYDTMVGCVYITEFDADQGALIQTLRDNIFTITVILEIAVILFSLIYSRRFSGRLQRIMTSMRIIQEGDYSHKVELGGHDELRFLGDEFNDLTERLRSSERKRAQFVSDASHELKTPLASIKLLSDSILQNDMDLETAREFVADIGNEADRLNRMTLKLLSLAKIESQENTDCEIINMIPTIDRVVRMLSVIAAENEIIIKTELTQDYMVLISEDDLYQIVYNLAENGIKYNIRGGCLTVTLDSDGENAILKVRDTGVGIPEDAISHVFERFYRVDKARSRQSGGSGLGLAIVRNMVERNNGTISVESTHGEGSLFTVTFPIFDTEEDYV